MQNLLNNLQNSFLNIYIILPFVFAFLFSVLTFFKNPVHIKRISNLLFLIYLIFSFVLFISNNRCETSIFNVDFSLNGLTLIFSLITTFIFFLVSIFSKTSVFKLHRLFRASLFALLGLLNTVISSDNIFCVILSIFWIFCLFYLLYTCYTGSEKYKKNITQQFIFDVFIILLSLFLIMYGFSRYFVLNDIPFNFSNIAENMYRVNPLSTILAFLGFLLLIFRFLIFIPFAGKIISISDKINPLIHNLVILSSIIAGSFLTIRAYTAFPDLFFEYQEFISLFLLINFIWFVFLSQRQDSLTKFVTSIFPAIILVSLFNLFSFKESGVVIYTYSSIINIISYCFLSFSSAVLVQKSGTDNISEFMKINTKNKILPFFVMLAILNCAGVPLLSIFSSRILTFINLFGSDFDGIFMNIIPFILVCGCFVLTISPLNILYKIFIAPIQTKNYHDYLCRNEVATLFLLLFAVLITGVFAYDICNLLTRIFSLGDL